ncbi:MAG: hypothetical protein JW828_16595 [Sedimentisphaerales bacterium]|nr:hypothetical protein [Sedimentisphaerales bacterium]
MKRAMTCLVLFAFQSAPLTAAIIDISLDATGTYVDGELRQFELDLSQTFTAIESMTMIWSGEVSPETYTECGGGGGTVLPGGFIANIHYGNKHIAQAVSDTSNIPWDLFLPEPLEMYPFDSLSPFSYPNNGELRLLEGPLTINIYPTGIGILLAIYCPLDRADGRIDSAVLRVEGTLIPEPATLTLLAAGFLLTRRRYR